MADEDVTSAVVDAVVEADTGATDQATIDAGVDEISEGLGFGKGADKPEAKADVAPIDKIDDETIAASEDLIPKEPVVTVRAAPKAWAKETHEIWAKLPPEAQAQIELREKQILDGLEQYKGDAGYGRQLREVTQPYRALLTAQGVEEPRAVQMLLNGHYKLSTGTPAERGAYLMLLAKNYGADVGAMTAAVADAPKVDPAVAELRDQVGKLTQSLTSRDQAVLTETRAKVAKEVEAFSTDPKNIYFDECADDIALLIKGGHTLQDAYDRAVYANPVTRAKELARAQTETDKALRAKAAAEAEAARKAKGTNVRSRDTRRAPTEPLGTMEDTMKATFKAIQERPH